MTECAKPGIDERYLVAGNATDLNVMPDQSGPVDVLIAAAWSPSRLGSAALRLHSEWSTACPPKQASLELIEQLAHKMPLLNGKTDRAAAQATADHWTAAELRRAYSRLRSLAGVREQLALQASKRGVDDPDRLAAVVLHHWLDPVCPACQGRKFQLAKGAPSLSVKVCGTCQGVGRPNPPGGQHGRWMLNYLDRSVEVARGSIKKRLRTIAEMK